jgi:hypothetical protein
VEETIKTFAQFSILMNGITKKKLCAKGSFQTKMYLHDWVCKKKHSVEGLIQRNKNMLADVIERQ